MRCVRHRVVIERAQSRCNPSNPTSGGTRLALTLWAEDPTLDHSAPPGRHVYTIYDELSLFRDISPARIQPTSIDDSIRYEEDVNARRTPESDRPRVCRLRENDLTYFTR